MRKALVWGVGLLLAMLPASAFAQIVEAGAIEVSGNTGGALTFQTMSVEDIDDDQDIKSLASTIGVYYYLGPGLAVGIAGNFGRFSTTIADSEATVSNVAIGPEIKLRFSGSDRVGLALVGGAGLANNKVDVEGQDLEGVSAMSIHTDGLFLSGGAEINVFINDFSAFTLGGRYQASKVKDADDIEYNVAGFTFGVGFSLFIQR
jgi:hypothetical protein